MRACRSARKSVASVVMIVQESMVWSPRCQCSASPANPKGWSFLGRDRQGLLCLECRSPFVEAVRHDQAPASLERRAERWLLGDPLSPGIDHAIADRGMVGPGGNQTPAEKRCLAFSVLEPDRQHLLGRGDVDRRRERRQISESEASMIACGESARVYRPHMMPPA